MNSKLGDVLIKILHLWNRKDAQKLIHLLQLVQELIEATGTLNQTNVRIQVQKHILEGKFKPQVLIKIDSGQDENTEFRHPERWENTHKNVTIFWR